jgi:Lipase (class 3)
MSKLFQKVISPHKFEPTIIKDKRSFNELWKNNQAWVFSNLSHIAYFRKDNIIPFMEKLGATKTYFYSIKHAQAFLSIWEDKAILAFRGTQSTEHTKEKSSKLSFFHKILIKLFIKFPINPFSLLGLNNDVLADLNFFQKNFDEEKKVKVHSGFLEELDKLWGVILSDIEKHTNTLPIWVTGHSLGGAMATIAGMKYPFEAVTTFGQPRVGRKINLAFKAKYHTRYVNGDDPVTKLPPTFFSYYKHHGEKIYITDIDGETSFIYDHSIIYYSENLYK